MSEDTSKFDRILARVRNYLDLADHPNTPPAEADLARERAELLMRDYKIEEEQAIAVDPAAMKPEWTMIDLCVEDEFSNQYFTMWCYIASHVGVKFRQSGRWDGGRWTFTLQVVGYASDLRLAELLYTNARLGFSSKLTPGVDPTLSEEENIYRLRSAGVVRGRVAEMLWGGQTHARNAKVGTVYKAECTKRGETPALDGRGTSATLHRKIYASEFTLEIARRLQRARQGADRSGGAVQLHGRAERVAEALYERYPEMRPVESAVAAEPTPCRKCKKLGYACRDHKSRPITKAERDRYERENYSATALAARAAGRRAAAEVPLDGSAPVARIDRYTEEERSDAREIWGAIER